MQMLLLRFRRRFDLNGGKHYQAHQYRELAKGLLMKFAHLVPGSLLIQKRLRLFDAWILVPDDSEQLAFFAGHHVEVSVGIEVNQFHSIELGFFRRTDRLPV